MTERSLYAPSVGLCRRVVPAAAAILLALASHVAGQPAAAPPCSACIVPVVSPGQALLVSEPLNGLEMLVDVRSAGIVGLRPTVEAIAAAGGRPGVMLDEGAALPPPDVLPLLRRLLVRVSASSVSPDELAFGLKNRLVEARALAPDVLLGIAADAPTIGELSARGLDPYVDFRAVYGAAAAELPGLPRSFGEHRAVAFLSGDGSVPATGRRWAVALPGDPIDAQQALRDLARTAPFLGEGLIAGGMVDVRCGMEPRPTYLDPETLATLAVLPPGCTPTVAGAPPGIEQVTLSSGESVFRVPAAEGRFAEGVRVSGERRLTVREIVARHQAAAARQRRAVRRQISTGAMTLTFEAPGFPAPMAITSEAVIFTAPDATDIEQRDIRVNGIAFGGGRVPRLPLLEPERVASPPLAISLSDVYAYELDGETTVEGARCYAVRFTPRDRSRPLFAGTAWIAVDTFAMVKVSAVQTALRGPIVSSEQTDHFAVDAEGLSLLTRSEVRQLYEGAGHRTPIHRVLTISRHEINPPEFSARRGAAYASPSVMLRDTAEGFRYVVREAKTAPSGTGVEEPARGVTLAAPAQRVRTLAMGVIIDPNISTPLPFAGLSYVDFNLFGTGTQVNGFFGGTYGQVAVSVPSLGGTRWQLAGRAFGIASSYNDRAFVGGRERYEWNISQRPAHASSWLLRPITARLSMRAGYELDYTAFNSSDSTSASFAVPAAQAAHSLRVALEGQWRGWASSIWWAGAVRNGWRSWGDPAGHTGVVAVGEYRQEHRDFQRAGVMLARSYVFSPRLVARVEGSYMAGRDLDRFSRYTFGSFDNRLRGYPSALIRYDRGGVLRAAAAWSAGRLLRIDGFLDSAYVRDPGIGPREKSYTGIGAAAEIPAPFGTLVGIEWGYGFQGLNASGRRGTQVVRISGYKIF